MFDTTKLRAEILRLAAQTEPRLSYKAIGKIVGLPATTISRVAGRRKREHPTKRKDSQKFRKLAETSRALVFNHDAALQVLADRKRRRIETERLTQLGNAQLWAYTMGAHLQMIWAEALAQANSQARRNSRQAYLHTTWNQDID